MSIIFAVKVSETYQAETTYLVGVEKKDDINSDEKIRKALKGKNVSTDSSRVNGSPTIVKIHSVEMDKDDEKEMRARLKARRLLRKALNEK